MSDPQWTNTTLLAYNDPDAYSTSTWDLNGTTMYRRKTKWTYGIAFPNGSFAAVITTHGDANILRVCEIFKNRGYSDLALSSNGTGGRAGMVIILGY